MPVFPEIKFETPQYCNLRQALQWLGDDLQPIDPKFEPVLGRPRFDVKRDYSRAKSAIYCAFLAGQIKLLGRLGRWHTINHDGGSEVSHYGDREELPITLILEAGLHGLNFESGELYITTEWDDNDFSVGFPLAGWQYIELVIPTADLMRVFPPSNSVEIPFTIELRSSDTGQLSAPAALPPRSLLSLNGAIERIADHTGKTWSEAAAALHNALYSGTLTANAADGNEVPCNVWRSYCPGDFVDHVECGKDRWWEADGLQYINPTVTAKSVDSWLLQPAATVPKHSVEPGFVKTEQHVPVERFGIRAAELPVYVQFLNEIVLQLGGCDRIAERKKADIEAEIKARWQPGLGRPSKNRIGVMATMLRSVEAQRGGAKPMRAAGSATSREGWNGSTPANKAATEVEAVSGGTV